MIHEAGDMTAEGVQRCVRCNVILTDYRNSMVPDGTPPMRGWEAGAFIEVLTGNPKYSGVTQEPPDCEPIQ